jgi:hypothetical protein
MSFKFSQSIRSNRRKHKKTKDIASGIKATIAFVLRKKLGHKCNKQRHHRTKILD